MVVVLALVGLAGVLVLLAADRFSRPELIGPGLLLFAIGGLTVGVHAVVTRYTTEHHHEVRRTTIFEGPSAVLIGVVFITLGLALAVAGVAFILGAQEQVYQYLLVRPGVALLPIGVASVCGGAARVLGARGWGGSLRRVLASIPERFSGLLLFLFGVALIGVGSFELAAPTAFDALLERLLAPLSSAPR